MALWKEIEFRVNAPLENTIGYELQKQTQTRLPPELWECIDRLAYQRYTPSKPLTDFAYDRHENVYQTPMIRAVQDSDYDEVKRRMACSTGSMRYPLLSVLKHVKKPWMIHVLLQGRKYPKRVYREAVEHFAYLGLDDCIMEMGKYATFINDKTVYRALIMLEKGIAERNNSNEVPHTTIKRILANVLKIPVEHLRQTIAWTDCL